MKGGREFLISDHHLGHDNVLNFERDYRVGDGINEHDEWLISQHNSRVSERDVTWFLGDVAFRMSALALTLPRMNGIKNLILGNHDEFDLNFYLLYFNKVRAMQPFMGGVLTHIPLHNGCLDRWDMNYHGHIHSQKPYSAQHICCCVEHCEGIPRTLEEWVA